MAQMVRQVAQREVIDMEAPEHFVDDLDASAIVNVSPGDASWIIALRRQCAISWRSPGLFHRWWEGPTLLAREGDIASSPS